MAELSKKIRFYDEEKLKLINPETLKLWKKYEIDMTLRELSPKSIYGYYNDLTQWWIYIYDNQGNQSIVDLDEDDITEFLYYCKTQGNNSRRMKRRISSIAAFYKFLRKKRIISENPTEFIDRPKKDTDIITQTFLTKEQVDLMREVLASYVDTHSNKHYAMQIQCYALLSLSTMARINAIHNIKWDMIDFQNRMINDVLEKEGYLVTLYFSKEVLDLLEHLRHYRADAKINDNGFVFVVSKGDEYVQASVGALTQWCKRVGELIDVPTLHPHDFRHSGATLLKNNGMSLEDVSALLNHQSTDVTNKFYIRADKRKVSENKDIFEV